VLPEACLPAVVAWLRGSGRLILSTEADREMSGRVEGAIRFVHAGGGWHAGAVSFRLQPGKAAVPPEADITVTAAGTAVYNPGDLPARPVYRLRGSGRMELRLRPAETCASLCVDPAGDERLAGLDGAVIDTDSMTVTDPDGAESLSAVTAFVRGDVSGLWIPPHAAVIVDAGFADASGATDSVVITPRWRWL
ncbi:MAG: hypothetical protein IKP10_03000, partial [Clostridia bacterium]|nr:hypothetical protein [Clostridia bacterium]